LYGFILFNVIEEAIIAIIAFIILFTFLPQFLFLGMLIVAIGLACFTGVKIYSYWSSSSIPVYDPLIGQQGIALTDFLKEGELWKGKVVVRGEEWKAQAEEAIAENCQIWVHGLLGLTLIVSTNPEDSKS
jgi:membrane-bound ClpP family serine protease